MLRSLLSGRRAITLLAIASLLLLPACGSASKTADQPKEKVRIGYLEVMDDAQVMVAKDAGFFDKHGLDAELQLFGSGTDLIKAIVGGQLQAGVLGFTNAVSWKAQGADVKVVGGAQMGYHSLLVGKDSGIKTVADLKGKRLASQKQGSTADIVLQGVTLKSAGLTRSDLTFSYVEPAAAIQALAAGQVDAAFVFEPFEKIAATTFGAQRIYEIGEVWPFPCMVVITSGKLLSENRALVDKILDAQYDAIKLLQSSPKEAARWLTPHFLHDDMVKSATGQEVPSRDVIEAAAKAQVFNWDITPQHITRMQEIIDIMYQQKVIEKQIQVEDVLDLSWQKSKGK